MIKRELSIFLIVGTLTVFVDFLSYRGLALLEITGIPMAKATGFIAGTFFAYHANRHWTFSHKSHEPGSIWRFVALYATTMGANVLVNSLALKLLDDAVGAVQLAFVVATGFSATLNFLGMKLFVFKSSSVSEPV